jgi:hypothetical protein
MTVNVYRVFLSLCIEYEEKSVKNWADHVICASPMTVNVCRVFLSLCIEYAEKSVKNWADHVICASASRERLLSSAMSASDAI